MAINDLEFRDYTYLYSLHLIILLISLRLKHITHKPTFILFNHRVNCNKSK